MRIIVMLLIILLSWGCGDTPKKRVRGKPPSQRVSQYQDTTATTRVLTPSIPSVGNRGTSKPVTGEAVEEFSSTGGGPISLTIEKKLDLPKVNTFNSYQTVDGVTRNDKIHIFEFGEDLSQFRFIIDDRSTNLISTADYKVITKWDGSMKDGINIVFTKVAVSTETPRDFVIFMIDEVKVSHIKLGQNTFWIKSPPVVNRPVEAILPAPQTTTLQHTVKYGENLKRIVNKYQNTLGPGDKGLAKLISLNPKLKGRVNYQIFPNETLIIK